jgi:hypothetical protein
MSTEWPVEYVVEGLMTTGTGEWIITPDVEGTLLLSREVTAHAAGMDLPWWQAKTSSPPSPISCSPGLSILSPLGGHGQERLHAG